MAGLIHERKSQMKGRLRPPMVRAAGWLRRRLPTLGATRIPADLSSVTEVYVGRKYDFLLRHAEEVRRRFDDPQMCKETNGGTRLELTDTSFLCDDVARIASDYGARVIELTVFRLRETPRPSDRGNAVPTDDGWVSELWHFDNFPADAFKILVYLSDVEEEQGPFEYKVPVDYRPPRPGLPLQSTRCAEDGQGQVVLGGPGTTIIFKNNIVHKGNYCRRGYRDAVMIGLRLPGPFAELGRCLRESSRSDTIAGQINRWMLMQRRAYFPSRVPPRPVRVLATGVRKLAQRFERRAPQRAPRGLARLVGGKRVCVVGPSRGALRNPPGLIESYDVVVRLNFTWPVRTEWREQMGTRCDVLYHCCNHVGDVRTILDAPGFAETKFVRLAYNMAQYPRFLAWVEAHNLPHEDFVHSYEMPYLQRHGEHLTKAINTGFFAICELLECAVAEIYVTGITFNCEDVFDGYAGLATTIREREGLELDKLHSADELFEIFKRLLAADDRIRIDATLADIIRLEETGRVERYEPH